MRAAETDLLEVNGEFSLSVVIARCKETPTGALRWRLRFDTGLYPDITVAMRMDADNRRPLDFYIFPRIDVASGQIRLAEEKGLSLDGYCFETLDTLYELAVLVRIQEAACERKSVGEGKSVSVRVDLGGRRFIKKKKN